MKILFAITKSNLGGAQRYVFDLATSLQALGCDVAVLSGGEGPLQRNLRAAGIRVLTLPSLQRDVSIWADWRSFVDLMRILRKERPDILHLNSSKMGALGALAGRLSGASRIVFTGHGWAFNEQRSVPSRIAIGIASWLTILMCHKTVAVSNQTKRQIERMPLVRSKLCVIYNGIRPAEQLDRDDARRRLAKLCPGLGCDPRALWLGAIAELHRNKGLDNLIRAVAKLSPLLPSQKVVIIGDGEERSNLQSLVLEHGLGQKVFLAGFVAEAARYMRALDIFVLPSRTEAMPYVILDAAASGIPIVASSVGGIPEVIVHESSGLLVEPNNVSRLHEALTRLINDPELGVSYADRARERITKGFDLDNMVRNIVLLYREVVDRTAAR